MYDEKVLSNIRHLTAEYKIKWGKAPLLSLLPRGTTQEKYVSVLERMVETGESSLVAFGFLRDNPPPTRREWYQRGYADAEEKYKDIIESMTYEIAKYRNHGSYEITEEEK